jgi:hypothetical protein
MYKHWLERYGALTGLQNFEKSYIRDENQPLALIRELEMILDIYEDHIGSGIIPRFFKLFELYGLTAAIEYALDCQSKGFLLPSHNYKGHSETFEEAIRDIEKRIREVTK